MNGTEKTQYLGHCFVRLVSLPWTWVEACWRTAEGSSISQVPEPWATRQACRFWSCPGLPLSHSGGVGAARTAHDGYSPALRRERASTAPSSSALLWLNPSELHSSAGASPHTSKFRGVGPVSLSGVPLAPLRPHSSQAAAGLSCLCTSILHPHGSWFRAR